MITDLILDALFAIIEGLVGLIPPLPQSVSTVLGDLPDQVAGVVDRIEKLGPLVPFKEISIALGITFIVWAFCSLFKTIHLVISLASGGGGAT